MHHLCQKLKRLQPHGNYRLATDLYFCLPLAVYQIYIKSSNSISAFFWHACHATPGGGKKYAGSSSYISMHLLVKLSNTSGSNSISFCTYRPCSRLIFVIQNLSRTFFCSLVVRTWDVFCKIHFCLAMKFHWI